MDDAATRDLLAAANAAIARRDWLAAQTPLESLLAAHPHHAVLSRTLSVVLNNLARTQLDHDPLRADALWQRALMLWPENAEALFNSAEAARILGDLARSRAYLERLRDLRPDDLDAHMALAEIETRERPERARALLAQLGELRARLSPEQVRRWCQACLDCGAEAMAQTALSEVEPTQLEPLAQRALQNALPELARVAFARLAAQHARDSHTSVLRAEIGARLGLPEVYRNLDELADARAHFERGLSELEREFDAASVHGSASDLAQWQWTNFLLAYHGQDDRVLQTRYGDWLARGLRDTPGYRDINAQPRGPGPQRIGLVSSGFRDCTVGAYFGAWPAALRGTDRTVTVVQLGPTFDSVTARIGASADTLVKLEGALEAMAERIRALDLDLLIFPDPASDARVMVLAALQLARRQAAAWGHPVTTGIPGIEVFFSCAEMEPADAASHYRERLLLLPGLGTHYARPALPPWPTRAALGLPAAQHLYLVPQSPYKIHPDCDTVLAEIAARDPYARLVMYEANRPHATQILRKRLSTALRAAGAEPERQLLLLPQTTRERFLQIGHVCDVMVDTLHWSGGNTAIDALLVDLPIVTCPGRYMRGRQSMAMLARLGLTEELTCSDPARLAERAVAIANDGARRADLAQRIAAGRESLFAGEDALRALSHAAVAMLDTP
jgi:CRISPR-associated protein Csy1